MRTFGLVALSVSTVSAAAVTPVQKVIQLLTEMRNKGDAEMKAEAVQQSTYAQWCKNTSKHKSEAIERASDEIDRLAAEIGKAQEDSKKAAAEVAELTEDVGRWNKDLKSSSEVRQLEAADYTATTQDYSETLQALRDALKTLRAVQGNTAQASLMQQEMALLQVKTATTVKKVVTKFLATQPAVPQANAYESQSGGVFDMLEELQDKFAAENEDLIKTERETKHAFQQQHQVLNDSIENANTVIERRTQFKEERDADTAKFQGQKGDTESDRAADTKYHKDLTTQCNLKAAAFENRQKLRGEELVAIDQAVDILGSDAVSGSANKHLRVSENHEDFMQSFIQMRSAVKVSNVQQKVASMLQQSAQKYNSNLLSMLATRAGNDAFTKVKKMIQTMISKLMAEGTAEQEHHGWCQAELGTNKITRETKTADKEELTATIESLTAQIAQLTEDVALLTKQVAQTDADRKEATDKRTAEKAKNEAAIADAKAAQVAVEQATTVLEEFYAKSGKAVDFLQQSPAEDAPDTFSEKYTGMGGESGGVLGMLEVIQTDFARLESETTAEEAEAADAYKTFMNDSEVDNAVKNTDIEHKNGLITKRTADKLSADKELKSTNEELDAAEKYYQKLKPSCVDSGITYEERVAKREEEIQSLKEALEVLTAGNADNEDQRA